MTKPRQSLADRILSEIPNSSATLTLPWRSKENRLPLWRLQDDEFELLWRRSLSIHDDLFFLMHLERYADDRLPRGKLFASLVDLVGPSSKFLDSYKQSFRFPFLHGVPEGKSDAMYLLSVHDIRGSLYFSSYRVVSVDDPRLPKHLLHEPFDDELTREDLNVLAATFYGFLNGYSGYVVPKPFVNVVQSQYFLYGFANEGYFEECHSKETDFTAAIEAWRSRIETEQNVDIPKPKKRKKRS